MAAYGAGLAVKEEEKNLCRETTVWRERREEEERLWEDAVIENLLFMGGGEKEKYIPVGK